MKHKFRAWGIDRKAYDEVDGCLLHLADGELWECSSGAYGMDRECVTKNFILEQYLGRNDATRTEEFPEGKPVYVGDIVKFSDHSYLAEVKYYPEYAAFLFDSHTEDTRNNPMTGMCWVDDFEVIGNIHQNPELLTPIPQGDKK